MYGLLRVNLVCQVEHERATEAYREAAETWERLKAADDTAREAPASTARLHPVGQFAAQGVASLGNIPAG